MKTDSSVQFHTIPEALEDIRAGRCIILVDDEDRENEGDLVLAAEKVTPDQINFMAKYGRGLICLALTPDRVEELKLPPQTNENTATFGTAFTVSIDAAKNITTGISTQFNTFTNSSNSYRRCFPFGNVFHRCQLC